MVAKAIIAPSLVTGLVQSYLSNPTLPVYFDTETTGLNPRSNRLVMAILKQGDEPAVKIDLRARPQLVKLLQPLFVGSVLIIGHNLKFDLEFLLANGVKTDRGRYFDTMIAEQILLGDYDDDDDTAGQVNLKATAARQCNLDVSKEERNWFIDLDQRPDEWAAPFPAEQLAYADQDVDVLGPIYRSQSRQLTGQKLDRVMQIEMDALPALARMEHNGITVDLEGWRAFIAEKHEQARDLEDQALRVFGQAILDTRVAKYDAELVEWHAARDAEELFIEELRQMYDGGEGRKAGVGWGDYKTVALKEYRESHPMPAKPKLDTSPPNIGSTDQLVSAFRALGIEVPTKRNDRGERVPTTASAELEKLAKTDKNIGLLVKHRKASKFEDAFGEPLLSLGEVTGEQTEEGHTLLSIHSDYQQIGAGTGRMSCRRPNFQQIPSKGDGKRVRQLVRARPGHQLLTADFSNMELRILASLAGRGAMFDALASGADLHSETARMMFGLGPEISNDEIEGKGEYKDRPLLFKPGLSYRAVAKTINFGLVYGMSAFKFSMDTGIPREEAERLIGLYFAAYPEVKRWLDKTAKEVHRTHASRTVADRMRKYADPGREPVWDRNPLTFAFYKERHREWEKAWAAIERKAKNTPIQGSSADITKRALGILRERLEPEVERIVAVVHDEIVVETPTELADYTKSVLAWAMEDAFKEFIDSALVPATEVTVASYWSK